MRPVKFPTANAMLYHPTDMTPEECRPLPVHTDGEVCTSLWKLSEDEIAQLTENGGYIWLLVHSGYTQPPVLMAVAEMEEKQ